MRMGTYLTVHIHCIYMYMCMVCSQRRLKLLLSTKEQKYGQPSGGNRFSLSSSLASLYM